MNTLSIFFAGSIRNQTIKDIGAEAFAQAWSQSALYAEDNNCDLVVFRIPTTDSIMDSDIAGIECFLQGLYPEIVKEVTDRRNQNIKDRSAERDNNQG